LIYSDETSRYDPRISGRAHEPLSPVIEELKEQKERKKLKELSKSWMPSKVIMLDDRRLIEQQ